MIPAPQRTSFLPALARHLFFRRGVSRPAVSPAMVLGLALVLFGGTAATADPSAPADLETYLAMLGGMEALDLDPAVPTPESVLGFEIGEQHIRPDLLVRYMERLAESSPRVRLETTGYTYEKRPLVLLTLSSEENQKQLDRLREKSVALTDPARSADLVLDELPVVVNLGYSVHGNEPSGSNAAPVVAYVLAAARNDEIRRLLSKTVVLLDPSLNPDGLARFAHWANMHKGRVPVPSAWSREHREGWPSGRTNHYWFDLNRDWLPAQHPESRARLAQFHAWRPNVLTDHHEMGSHSTFFFQPGVPERKHPLTPERNVELTAALARHHAEAFDALGTLYYSEETFDDFYYGKGSTYPDVNGAVGILFEQASSRGHLRESENGMGGRLSFPQTIRNQVAVSFSTLRGAVEHRPELLAYQRDFFREALDEGKADPKKAWIFGDSGDPARSAALADILLRHGIEVRRLKESLSLGGEVYEPGSAYVVPLAQAQYRLVRAAFESLTEFRDATFYDVSAWTLPKAFGLPFAALERDPGDLVGEAADGRAPTVSFTPNPSAYAYAFPWQGYFAPRSLYRLLDAGVEARLVKQPFADESGEFALGTVLVPMGLQTLEREKVEELLTRAAEEDGTRVFTFKTGLTPTGADLGSPGMRRLVRPRPAILVEGRTDAYEAGQAWHLLDHRFEIETGLVSKNALGEALGELTHLVLVEGAHLNLGPEEKSELRDWIEDGGVLIAWKDAAEWAGRELLSEVKPSGGESPKSEMAPEPAERRPYGQARADRAVDVIGGSIFQVELDLTHPLAYGYSRETLPVFRNSRIFLEPSANPYATPAVYTDAPLLAGYVSADNLKRLSGSPAIVADRLGEGVVVQMADDPTFRAFWWGTQKLLLNALFFGHTPDTTAPGGRHENH